MKQENREKAEQKNKEKPVTMRISELRVNLDRVVAESELPPFLLEILLGEYLSGISIVARREYEQDRETWENLQKAGEEDGRHQ